MTTTLDGHSLTIEKVDRVARGNESIDIHPEAIKRIKKCRDLLEDKIKKREIMYGVNTGIGELSEVVLTQEQVEKIDRIINDYDTKMEGLKVQIQLKQLDLRKLLLQNETKKDVIKSALENIGKLEVELKFLKY